MRLARLHGPGDLRVDTVSQPELNAGAVRVEVAYTGICGSDLHEYTDGPVPIRAERTDHRLSDDERQQLLPKPMGHEIAGTISAVGEGVEDVNIGDRVTINVANGCGRCRYCVDGNYHLCVAGTRHVVTTPGFADELVVPAEAIVPVPDDVSLRHAAMVEPLSVSAHGVTKGDVSIGDHIAVFGAGPIGLGVVSWARAAGASTILVSEPNGARRRAADEMGADETIDPTETNAREFIREYTDGGTDVSFETAGVETALTDALRSTAYGETVVVLSVFSRAVSVHPNDIMQAERRVIGSFAFGAGPKRGRSEFTATVNHLSKNRINAEPMLSDVIPLSDVEDGFERLQTADSEDIKILVEP